MALSTSPYTVKKSSAFIFGFLQTENKNKQEATPTTAPVRVLQHTGNLAATSARRIDPTHLLIYVKSSHGPDNLLCLGSLSFARQLFSINNENKNARPMMQASRLTLNSVR